MLFVGNLRHTALLPMDGFKQWAKKAVDKAGKEALDTIKLFQNPEPAFSSPTAEAARQGTEEVVMQAPTGRSADTLSWAVLLITVVVGLAVAALTLLSERKPLPAAVPSTAATAATQVAGSTVASPAAASPATASATDRMSLPLPPSALPPPPSAPMGATMMMDASYVAVGSHDGNGDAHDFEIVGK